METALTQLNIRISPPRLFPPPLATKPHFKPHAAVSCGSPASKWADRLLADFQFIPSIADSLDDATSASPSPAPPPDLPSLPERYVSIPLDFYRVLGAEPHFLGNGIRRAYDARVSAMPRYGYSDEVLISRRQILQAACETLATPGSRREYNQGLADHELDTILIQVPWDKVPGALCLLQEAGETELVLQIGESLLKEKLPKSYKKDIVLSMALAYVDLARDSMVLSPPDFIRGREVLEMALKLLQEESASNLAPDLQAQINETLEEIIPRCVLELLALPLDTDYQSKRGEGLQGVRNILWAVGGGGPVAIAGGFIREDFMKEAFLHMTASEQVDLFAATPSNIPAESFEVYGVALALVSQAFMCKKPHLIQDADTLFQQLQQTKIASMGPTDHIARENFALERGLCSLLVGDVDACHAWLGLDSRDSKHRDPSIVNFVMEHSKDERDGDLFLPGLCKLLEIWLAEVVFPRFRETQGVGFKLGDYYDDPKVLRYLEKLQGAGRSPLAAAASIARIGAKATTSVLDNVKVSVVQVLQKVFPLGRSEKNVMVFEENKMENDELATVVAVENGNRAVGGSQQKENIADEIKDATVKIMCAGVVVGVLTLAGLKFLPLRNGSDSICKDVGPNAVASEVIDAEGSVAGNCGEIPQMDARFAENLVQKWQSVKSRALGPHHSVRELSEILDGQMLKTWSEKAAEATQHGWFWDYRLVNLNIDSVTVSVDGHRAIVEATLEESARLTDLAHPEHDDSYSTTYTTRYDMCFVESGWKIVEGAVLKW